jgi:hypothetical protein
MNAAQHPFRRRARAIAADNIGALLHIPLLLISFFLLNIYIQQKNILDIALSSKDPSYSFDCGGYSIDPTTFYFIQLTAHDSVQGGWLNEDFEPEITTFSIRELPAKIAAHVHRKPNLCVKGMNIYERRETHCWYPIFIVEATRQARYGNIVKTLNMLTYFQKNTYLLDLHDDSGFWDSEFLRFYQSIQQKEKPRLAAQSTVL